jgi:hypothetical protein
VTFALLVLWFISYWAGMAAVIWLDGKRQRGKARAAGAVDFIDRNPLPYMLMGALCGPIPLILYFGITRKSAAGWALGIGIGVGWSVLFSLLYSVIQFLARTRFGY